MRILVKGSLQKPNEYQDYLSKHPQDNLDSYEVYRQRFIEASKALGTALARHNHTIVVGVPNWSYLRECRTVANFIIEGASSEPVKNERKHLINFYIPADPEPPNTTQDILDTIEEFKRLPNITIKEEFLGKGNWSAAMIPDLQYADAVILVGGGEGTATIGYAAYSMQKPLIPLTAFGGAAQSLYDNVVYGNYERYLQQKTINAGDLRLLQATWSETQDSPDNPKHAEAVVDFAERLTHVFTQSSRRAASVLGLTIGYMLAFVLLWLAIFLRRTTFEADVAFFMLLFIAAIFGTGLRMLSLYQNGEIGQITYMNLGISIAIAIVVGLGLAMIYLIGGISYTGKVVVLTAQQNETFVSIAVTMSLLGMAAGYLVPLKQLEERLTTIIAPDQKTP